MKKVTRKGSKKFAPAAWQWDGSQLADLPDFKIQMWSAAGCMMGLVTAEKARELVAARAFFIGSSVHICQVHEGIDGANAGAA